jgi:hypothetical protein
MKKSTLTILLIPVVSICMAVSAAAQKSEQNLMQRQRISINESWSFYKYESNSQDRQPGLRCAPGNNR